MVTWHQLGIITLVAVVGIPVAFWLISAALDRVSKSDFWR